MSTDEYSKKEHFNKEGINILACDDDSIVRCSLKHLLSDDVNFNKVKIVATGEEAIKEFLNDDSYQIIITDIRMPVINGFSVEKIIREHAEKNNKKVFIYSFSADDKNNDFSKFDRNLLKPLDADKLLSVIMEDLGNI